MRAFWHTTSRLHDVDRHSIIASVFSRTVRSAHDA